MPHENHTADHTADHTAVHTADHTRQIRRPHAGPPIQPTPPITPSPISELAFLPSPLPRLLALPAAAERPPAPSCIILKAKNVILHKITEKSQQTVARKSPPETHERLGDVAWDLRVIGGRLRGANSDSGQGLLEKKGERRVNDR